MSASEHIEGAEVLVRSVEADGIARLGSALLALTTLPTEEREPFIARICKATKLKRKALLARLSEIEGPQQSGPMLLRARDVTCEPVSWLWPSWMPRGALVTFDSDPGDGKTTVAIDVAARLSRGEPMPGESVGSEPSATVLMSLEDMPGRTLVPRLKAAGADLDRVAIFNAVSEPDGGKRLPVLPADLEHVERAINEMQAGLLVIDPLTAAIDLEVNLHRDQHARSVLAKLAALAERTNCAILMIRHLNKQAGGSALYRGGGSIGIVGAARVGWIVARHPENPGVRILACVKNNLAREPKALEFSIEETTTATRVMWIGESAHTASTALSAPANHEERNQNERACEWLRDQLAAGPVPSRDLEEHARAIGISARTYDRARQKLGVRARQDGPRNWVCYLSERQQTQVGVLTHEQPPIYKNIYKKESGRQDAKDARVEDGGALTGALDAAQDSTAAKSIGLSDLSPSAQRVLRSIQ